MPTAWAVPGSCLVEARPHDALCLSASVSSHAYVSWSQHKQLSLKLFRPQNKWMIKAIVPVEITGWVMICLLKFLFLLAIKLIQYASGTKPFKYLKCTCFKRY